MPPRFREWFANVPASDDKSEIPRGACSERIERVQDDILSTWFFKRTGIAVVGQFENAFVSGVILSEAKDLFFSHFQADPSSPTLLRMTFEQTEPTTELRCKAGERDCKLETVSWVTLHLADAAAKAFKVAMRLQAHLSTVLIALAGSGVVAGTGAWLLLRGRKKKTDAERERDRRLAINAIGRMTDGSLTEALLFEGESKSAMLFYRYSVAGVEYSAAQEISDLTSSIRPGTYLPGEAITIKYDPQHPPNSIVVCEQWSGLHGRGEHGSDRSSAQGSRAVSG